MKKLVRGVMSMALAPLLFVIAAMSAATAATPLVDASWLERKLVDDRLVLIDLRNKLDGGSHETYLEGHIPSAVHSDYLRDGWRVGRDDVVGLLPEASQFEALARKLGVSSGSHVVLVTHGGWIRALLADLLTMPGAAMHRLDVPYACLSRLRVVRDGRHSLCQLVAHNIDAGMSR